MILIYVQVPYASGSLRAAKGNTHADASGQWAGGPKTRGWPDGCVATRLALTWSELLDHCSYIRHNEACCHEITGAISVDMMRVMAALVNHYYAYHYDTGGAVKASLSLEMKASAVASRKCLI